MGDPIERALPAIGETKITPSEKPTVLATGGGIQDWAGFSAACSLGFPETWAFFASASRIIIS